MRTPADAAPDRDPGTVLRSIVAVLRGPVTAMVRRDWSGAEHLPRHEGFVVAANHVSHSDPVMLAHFLYDNGVPPRYLAKAAILDLPVAGRILRATGQIPVYRGTANAADAYAAAKQAVLDGEGVIFYPEGTITRDPDEWPMSGKTGVARVSLETGCPVIPVAQWGPNLFLEPYGHRPRFRPRQTMHISAGPPVDLDDLRGREITAGILAEATDRIMDAVTQQLALVRGVPAPSHRMSRDDPRVKERPHPRRQSATKE
ncbi:1-acyl-sn-glycerol-3-phosphate acyltransferase [Mumia zhuanghuii]|uniref:Lysophospholipid acyltransferase family protein n=2 Tax=Mumia TaxID=1546255 RepID=A0ABW1QIS4_9ACTN|nr:MULTISPECIES: lysophospholipid acyltransferase family protein [Mumia]KAA1423627.1 1-acyl-sn-glycerol-3-phosphate acyltransferase [Mumia zhuanghuii]